MTEAEWLACDRIWTIEEALDGKMTRGRLARFVCACWRHKWGRLGHQPSERLIEAAEQLLNGVVSKKRVRNELREAAKARVNDGYERECRAQARCVALIFLKDSQPPLRWFRSRDAWQITREIPDQTVIRLLQDVCGPLPFRSTTVPRFILDWNGATVLRLASGINASGCFDDLPILADALEEAGCDNAEILAHCRGPGPHVRGCWVVDLLLGKG